MADITKGSTIIRTEDGSLIIGEGASAMRVASQGGNLVVSDASVHVGGAYPNQYPFGGYPNPVTADDDIINLSLAYPPDNIPVAHLPAAIRAAKRFVTYYSSTKAAFSNEVADGDIVFLDVDGFWKPALAPLTQDAVDPHKVIFYGVAMLSRGEVAIGPVVKNTKWSFSINDKLYLSNSAAGKLTKDETTVQYGVAVTQNTIYVASLGANLNTLLDKWENIISKRIEALETIVGKHTQEIADEKKRLDEVLKIINELRTSVASLEGITQGHTTNLSSINTKIAAFTTDLSVLEAKVEGLIVSGGGGGSSGVVMHLKPFITTDNITDYQVGGDGVVLDSDAYNTFVVLDGVVQEPRAAYTIIGSDTIRFTSNPGGGKRGWGMASMNLSHPDFQYIYNKMLAEIQKAGTAQIEAVGNATQSKIEEVNQAGNDKISEIESIGTDLVPIATTEIPGKVQVGAGLSITPEGVLSADAQSTELPIATDEVLGGVMPQIGADDGLSLDAEGRVRVKPATKTERGSVLASVEIAANAVPQADENGVIADSWFQKILDKVEEGIPGIATKEKVGVIKVGSGLAIQLDGTLDVVSNAIELVFTESDNSWKVPETGIYTVTCIGGGGKGGSGGAGNGGASYRNRRCGGGGGGGSAGAYITSTFALEKDTVIPIVVGGPGGASSFGSYITASGGNAGGVGGTADTNNGTGGTSSYSGGAGSGGSMDKGGTGGKGGPGYGTDVTASNGSNGQAGPNTGYVAGTGGAGGKGYGAGGGGGGGGGYNNNVPGYSGGAGGPGAQGVVIIRYTSVEGGA